MSKPKLTFFCELAAGPLAELFADPAVVEHLKAMKAGVSLGLVDLSDERAEVVRRLNAAGVPVTAWQLLPEAQGYWYNLDNAPQTIARYVDFTTWTERHDLHWAAIGVDIEPDIREMERLMAGEWSGVLKMLGRLFDRKRVDRAQRLYEGLIDEMHADGYEVESYHIPVIVDERRVGSTLLQRLFGLIDLPVDREVLMLYSSFLRPHGAGALWSYAPEAEAIAVGSTGGGVTVGGADEIPPLTWEELARDLRLAWQWSDALYVFSLEGCVRQGYLARLRDFKWERDVMLPVESAHRVARMRRVGQALLWAGAHPALVLGTMGAATLAVFWLASVFRRERAS
ncbi:MAG: hypothetical protein ACP5HM_08895 [Anaerolineae bacterium]